MYVERAFFFWVSWPAGDVEDVDGITLRWDPEDKESDPSGEFPFGC